MMITLRLGSEFEFIQIDVPGYLPDGASAQAHVQITVDGFRGTLDPWFQAGDFDSFYQQASALYSTLKGKAELSPRELQFALALEGDGLGHIWVKGSAWSQATFGNQLKFGLSVDQTELAAFLTQLAQVRSVASES